jgi:hypothetical protein
VAIVAVVLFVAVVAYVVIKRRTVKPKIEDAVRKAADAVKQKMDDLS